jgi:hypothetical protein
MLMIPDSTAEVGVRDHLLLRWPVRIGLFLFYQMANGIMHDRTSVETASSVGAHRRAYRSKAFRSI